MSGVFMEKFKGMMMNMSLKQTRFFKTQEFLIDDTGLLLTKKADPVKLRSILVSNN